MYFLIRGGDLHVGPLVRDLVPAKEILQLVTAWRPARAQYSQTLIGGLVVGLPIFEQIIQHRVKLFLGRIPRLQQVVMDSRGVDRGNRRVGICIRSEEGAFGLGKELHALAQYVESGHVRHALIGERQGEAVPPGFQLLQKIDRATAGIGSQNAVILPIPAA